MIDILLAICYCVFGGVLVISAGVILAVWFGFLCFCVELFKIKLNSKMESYNK